MHDANVELLGSACEMLAGSILADAPIPEKLEPVPGRSDDTKIPWENMGRKMGTYEKIWKKREDRLEWCVCWILTPTILNKSP